ncbi:MAG: energy transducer TonB [bacterium]|nr:energy transducer TonB [bacterium]
MKAYEPFILKRRKMFRPFGISAACHVTMVIAAIWFGGSVPAPLPIKRDVMTLLAPSDLHAYLPKLPPAQKAGGGGGGGGDRSPINASIGRLPKLAKVQIAPPSVIIRNRKPKLAVEPSIIVPPQIQLPDVDMSQLGDPWGQIGPPSNGPGIGGGIGSGSGGGVGSGDGEGFGPGSNGGAGGGVYRIGGDVTAPQIIHKVEPEYADEARRAKHQGTVELRVQIGSDGNVHHVTVIKGLGLGLDEKAIEAVRQWKFRPAMRNGMAVTVNATVLVTYRLL